MTPRLSRDSIDFDAKAPPGMAGSVPFFVSNRGRLMELSGIVFITYDPDQTTPQDSYRSDAREGIAHALEPIIDELDRRRNTYAESAQTVRAAKSLTLISAKLQCSAMELYEAVDNALDEMNTVAADYGTE